MADRELADRLRDALAEQAPLRERAMFGWRCFLVDDRITVGANAHGGLLVRCDPDRTDELLGRPSATWAVMKDRRMGPGWIVVGADGIADDGDLAFWVDVALEHHRRA
jgi:hypothetical protein